MSREADVKIAELMKEKQYLEAKLQLIVKELRLTVLKNSVINVNAHNTTYGR